LKTILVIGGYGGFGGRLSRRLSRSGYRVLVGGRSLRKARAFCNGLQHCRPIGVDRHGDVAAILLAERPNIVVDAAGPFQHSDYRVIEACIGARVAYIYLAEARDFVTGVGRFDDKAKVAGVPIISGASSVPALSHAIVAELAAGLDQVSAIEIAIGASSRASAGPSVSKAILRGVGQELQHWSGHRWQANYGWQSIRAERFDLPSGKSLGRR
jgi:saccharopine dehydrogenase-like NADP-dependent oxidoreductase